MQVYYNYPSWQPTGATPQTPHSHLCKQPWLRAGSPAAARAESCCSLAGGGPAEYSCSDGKSRLTSERSSVMRPVRESCFSPSGCINISNAYSLPGSPLTAIVTALGATSTTLPPKMLVISSTSDLSLPCATPTLNNASSRSARGLSWGYVDGQPCNRYATGVGPDVPCDVLDQVKHAVSRKVAYPGDLCLSNPPQTGLLQAL